MLKDFLKKKGISIYALANDCKLPYSTVNDLCNHKVDVENCKAGILKKISDCLGITMDELYNLLIRCDTIYLDEYDLEAKITVKGKHYHSEFTYDNTHIDLDICRVCESTAKFIRDFALWDTEDYLDGKSLEDLI